LQAQAKKRPLSISPSRWATLYDAPLPPSLASMCATDKCQLCDVDFNGPTISRSHYDGKAHEKKVAQYLAANVDDEASRPKKIKISCPNAEETNSSLSCSLCNLVCTSTVVYDSHMQGKNHASKVRAANSSKSGELGCALCNIFVTSPDALTNHLAGKQHKRKSERMRDIQGGLQLHCSLCGVNATDRPGLEAHLKGKRHLEKLERKNKKEEDEKEESSDTETKNVALQETDLALQVSSDAKKIAPAKIIDYNTYEFKSFDIKEDEINQDETI